MKKTDFNKLTVSIAFTLITALCIPALAGAGTTEGSVRNNLTDVELDALNREEDSSSLSASYTNVSIGSVRAGLSDAGK